MIAQASEVLGLARWPIKALIPLAQCDLEGPCGSSVYALDSGILLATLVGWQGLEQQICLIPRIPWYNVTSHVRRKWTWSHCNGSCEEGEGGVSI